MENVVVGISGLTRRAANLLLGRDDRLWRVAAGLNTKLTGSMGHGDIIAVTQVNLLLPSLTELPSPARVSAPLPF